MDNETLNRTPDTSIQDHLNPNSEDGVNTDGYIDIRAPRKKDKQEYIDLGYEVIKETLDSDLILVGKKIGA